MLRGQLIRSRGKGARRHVTAANPTACIWLIWGPNDSGKVVPRYSERFKYQTFNPKMVGPTNPNWRIVRCPVSLRGRDSAGCPPLSAEWILFQISPFTLNKTRRPSYLCYSDIWSPGIFLISGSLPLSVAGTRHIPTLQLKTFISNPIYKLSVVWYEW